MFESIEEESIGPLYPDPDELTLSQLLAFSEKLKTTRISFVNKSKKLLEIGPRLFNLYLLILFDSQLFRAQLLQFHWTDTPKTLLLRLLQRFLDLLKEHKACIIYSDWFQPASDLVPFTCSDPFFYPQLSPANLDRQLSSKTFPHSLDSSNIQKIIKELSNSSSSRVVRIFFSLPMPDAG